MSNQSGCTGDSKERKKELADAQLINCSFCKYNRGENTKRKAKPDAHKNINRETLRRVVDSSQDDEESGDTA